MQASNLIPRGSECVDPRNGRWTPPLTQREVRLRRFKILSQGLYAKCRCGSLDAYFLRVDASGTYYLCRACNLKAVEA